MLEWILLILAVVVDSFVVSLAYGSSRIRIPIASALLMSLVGTATLLLAMVAAGWIGRFLPENICKAISFTMLFSVGICSLFQNFLKTLLKRSTNGKKQLRFQWAELEFFFSVCLDEMKADADASKVLTGGEALVLGLALSLDSIATGFGSGLMRPNLLLVAAIAVLFHLGAILFGVHTGNRLHNQPLPSFVHPEWLGGILLVVLAVSRII